MRELGYNNYLTEMLPPYGIELFLRLIFVHLLADFVFQPDCWMRDRPDNGWDSKYLVYHAVVAGLSALLFVNLWNIVLILRDPAAFPEFLSQLWIPLLYAFILIAVSHFIIDGLKPGLEVICQKIVKIMNCKEKQKDKDNEPVCVLIIDQIAHLIVLFIVLAILYPQALLLYPFGDPIRINKIWIVLIAFLLILWPSGILISRITRIWRTGKDIAGVQAAFLIDYDFSLLAGESCTRIEKPQEIDALDKGGRWIGYLERLLIVTFILVGDYTAIGFLVAAKGLFRFNDSKRAEYVIVGTLLSFTIAVLIGATARYLINLSGT